MDSTQISILVLVALVALVWIYRKVKKAATIKLLRKKMSSRHTILDVRTPGEYRQGHIEGAKNIPLDKLAGKGAKIGKPDDTIIVYCASGARSAAAAGQLKAAGFSDVINAGPMSVLADLA